MQQQAAQLARAKGLAAISVGSQLPHVAQAAETTVPQLAEAQALLMLQHQALSYDSRVGGLS